MKMLKAKLHAKYKQYPISSRFYVASVGIYLIGLLISSKVGILALSVGTTVASALIICGFIAWCYPFARWLHTAWEKPFAKTPIVILHLLVLLTSTACARYAVAETLGLPPQSFDLTVGLLALLFYIPSWLLVVALILGLAALLIMIIALVSMLFEAVWLQLSILFKRLGYQPALNKTRNMIMFHSAGAMIGSLLLASSFGYLTENFSPAFKTVTKIIALRSDFHRAPNYPGVDPKEYVHPLENGFIAFAREQDDKSVVFGVRSQRTDTPELVVETIPSANAIVTAAVKHLQSYLAVP